MIKDILMTTKNIIEGVLPYQIFTKDLASNNDYSADEKQVVRLLVNGLLNRYHRYFYSLTSGEESDLTMVEVLALGLYSFNVEKKVTSISYEALLSALPSSSQIKIEDRYPASSFPITIPQAFHTDNVVLSYAARFSAPLFLIETLVSDVGKKNILRFLASRPQDNSGIINEKVIKADDFYAREKEFSPSEKAKEFNYHGKDYIKKTKAYLNNEIILASQSLIEISALIAENNVESLLFVQHEDTTLLLLLALTYPNLKIDFFAEDTKAKFIIQHLIKKFDIKNIQYVTHITKTYDFVVTTLTSSRINGNIRHRDFYFRLSEDLNSYAIKASEELAAIKDYVSNNGALLFVTATALRNETHYQALSLIRDNPDFSLTREKQYYHFNKYHETIYFALFRRGSNDE